MVNINKILITHINLSDNGYLPPLNLFDYHIFYNLDEFIGVAINSPDTLTHLVNSGPLKMYDVEIFTLSKIPNEIKDSVLGYLGLNLDVDNILDLIGDSTVDVDRKFYLKSVLYYKTNQEGKNLLKYNLTVKHFDDLVHFCAEDFVNYKIISNNDDFSESEIILETYLTEDELKNKFKEHL